MMTNSIDRNSTDPSRVELHPGFWRVWTVCCGVPIDLPREIYDLQLMHELHCSCTRRLRLSVTGDARHGLQALWIGAQP
jgi:hypothetical protein